MNEYNFTLVYQLVEDELADQYLDALFEAGCDDALIGVAVPGRISLEFDREASNPIEALLSAQTNVKSAIPHAKLVSAGPDLVNLSEVAGLLNVTRQHIQKLQYKVSFPQPICEVKMPLYHLYDVVTSLQPKLKNHIELVNLLQGIGLAARRVNLDIEKARIDEIDPLPRMPVLAEDVDRTYLVH